LLESDLMIRINTPTDDDTGFEKVSSFKRPFASDFPLSPSRVPHVTMQFKRPVNSTSKRVGFGGMKSPFTNFKVKPIMDFPMIWDSKLGNWRVQVDFIVLNFKTMAELTKEFGRIMRNTMPVEDTSKAIDATFLRSLAERLCIKIPDMPGVLVEHTPESMEEWCTYFHADYAMKFKGKSQRIFEEIGNEEDYNFADLIEPGSKKTIPTTTPKTILDDPKKGGAKDKGKGYISVDGNTRIQKSDPLSTETGNSNAPFEESQATKTKFYKVSVWFLLMTPEAMAEILIEAVTSKHTIPRYKAPMFTPDPNAPCSFLAANITPGHATNISRVNVNTDKENMAAMMNLVKDMENFHNPDVDDGSDILDDGSTDEDTFRVPEKISDNENPFLKEEDEEVFFQRLYNKEIGFTGMENCQINMAQETQYRVMTLVDKMGTKASKITYTEPKGGIIDSVLAEAIKRHKESGHGIPDVELEPMDEEYLPEPISMPADAF